MKRVSTIVAAFAIATGAAVLLWRAFDPGSTDPRSVWPHGYPSPPGDGYYILLPDRAEPVDDSTKITAVTNLPDGTLIAISTTTEGICCPPVRDSRITFTIQDQACYGSVGEHPGASTFDVTITTKPDFEPWVVPGPGLSEAPLQPDSVLRLLGPRFERLSGEQVREQDDGSRWLVAERTMSWPQPRCGGDPIPLFGGPRCSPEENGQLQGDGLAEAMGEVMGAISQGRMCEFWSLMLPEDVEEAHPWPAFADEWRSWLLRQDFSVAEPTADWSTGPLRWVEGDRDGEAIFANVLLGDRTIATLELRPLLDHCPGCAANVVPFWGVVSWQLY